MMNILILSFAAWHEGKQVDRISHNLNIMIICIVEDYQKQSAVERTKWILAKRTASL